MMKTKTLVYNSASFVVEAALEKGDVIEVLREWQVHSDFQGGIHMQFLARRFMPNKMRVFLDFIENRFTASAVTG